MAQIHVTDTAGETKTIQIEEGKTLMELLRDHDFEEVVAMCGGCCSCATCHVHITKPMEQLSEVEEDEAMLLEMAENYNPELSRLSCQIELDEQLDGLAVQIVEN